MVIVLTFEEINGIYSLCLDASQFGSSKVVASNKRLPTISKSTHRASLVRATTRVGASQKQKSHTRNHKNYLSPLGQLD